MLVLFYISIIAKDTDLEDLGDGVMLSCIDLEVLFEEDARGGIPFSCHDNLSICCINTFDDHLVLCEGPCLV